MRSLDRSRFIYSLAGEWLAREWTVQAMKAALRTALPDRPFRVPKLVERVYANFTSRPDFHQLVAVLNTDNGLARAIGRAGEPKRVRSRPPSLRPPTMAEPPLRLLGIDIPKLPTENALAEWFGESSQVLRWLADPAGRNRKHPPGPLRTYRYRWIPRREGIPRLLEILKFSLRKMQRKILKEILDAVPLHPAAHGFRAGRSIITNAQPHCGKPTSPALANLAAGRLDRRLVGLATAAGATYTRYADDLTFSGDGNLARSRKRLETHVAVIAHEEGFAVNHRKTRLMRAGVRQLVTGVVVNVRPNIPRSEYDQMKAILTNCVRLGPASQNRQELADFRAHLAGKIAHIASIHPARGTKLRTMFDRISWDIGDDTPSEPAHPD